MLGIPKDNVSKLLHFFLFYRSQKFSRDAETLLVTNGLKLLQVKPTRCVRNSENKFSVVYLLMNTSNTLEFLY